MDAFDLGSYVKAWSELDYSGSDIYPYDGSQRRIKMDLSMLEENQRE